MNNKYFFKLIFNLIICFKTIESQLHWEKIVDSLSYQLTSKPAPRRDAAIGHDKERNRAVIFGGWQQLNEQAVSISIPVLFDDTWEFNLETSKIKLKFLI
jgi:hypothetical protein